MIVVVPMVVQEDLADAVVIREHGLVLARAAAAQEPAGVQQAQGRALAVTGDGGAAQQTARERLAGDGGEGHEVAGERREPADRGEHGVVEGDHGLGRLGDALTHQRLDEQRAAL